VVFVTEWMSVREAAEELNVDARQVRNLIADEVLEARRIGRAWLVEAGSVRARAARQVPPGRPPSPVRAWQLLGVLSHALRPEASGDAEIEERWVRYQLANLLAHAPGPQGWDTWLRNRAKARRVWFHPAARARLVEDPRVARSPLSDLLGLWVEGSDRFYVSADHVDAVIADHDGRELEPGDDAPDALPLMVVPGEVRGWREHVAAAGVVDLVENRDARLQHAARDRLRRALQSAGAGSGASAAWP
jgi:excisionase family DNA binding protein